MSRLSYETEYLSRCTDTNGDQLSAAAENSCYLIIYGRSNPRHKLGKSEYSAQQREIDYRLSNNSVVNFPVL